MGSGQKTKEREGEIIAFFYRVFGYRVHRGMNSDDARKEAYDAVTLRYGIGKGRLLNIISSRRNSQNVKDSAFRENARSLISELTAANHELQESLDKNNKLISLLKECLDDR